jgi:hypothetical protein
VSLPCPSCPPASATAAAASSPCNACLKVEVVQAELEPSVGGTKCAAQPLPERHAAILPAERLVRREIVPPPRHISPANRKGCLLATTPIGVTDKF